MYFNVMDTMPVHVLGFPGALVKGQFEHVYVIVPGEVTGTGNKQYYSLCRYNYCRLLAFLVELLFAPLLALQWAIWVVLLMAPIKMSNGRPLRLQICRTARAAVEDASFQLG